MTGRIRTTTTTTTTAKHLHVTSALKNDNSRRPSRQWGVHPAPLPQLLFVWCCEVVCCVLLCGRNRAIGKQAAGPQQHKRWVSMCWAHKKQNTKNIKTHHARRSSLPPSDRLPFCLCQCGVVCIACVLCDMVWCVFAALWRALQVIALAVGKYEGMDVILMDCCFEVFFLASATL